LLSGLLFFITSTYGDHKQPGLVYHISCTSYIVNSQQNTKLVGNYCRTIYCKIMCI